MSRRVIPLYGGIGRSRGGVNPPVVVRHPFEGANPPEAPHQRCGAVHSPLYWDGKCYIDVDDIDKEAWLSNAKYEKLDLDRQFIIGKPHTISVKYGAVALVIIYKMSLRKPRSSERG